MQYQLIRPDGGPRRASDAVPKSPQRSPEAWPLPGLCWNARVTTSFGDMPVQGLRLRDPVKTSTGRFLPVRWIDRIHLDEDFLASCPDARPITISPGAFGSGGPAGPLTLSPQQRLNTASGAFGQNIRPARDLEFGPYARRASDTTVTYYLFHLGEPALVLAEGILVSTTP